MSTAEEWWNYNVKVNAETLGVERKRTHVEVLSKVVI